MDGYRFRDWLKAIEDSGELKRISGASCELEMSSLAEILNRESRQVAPATLFDEIPGYAKGRRTMFGLLASLKRLALALGISNDWKDELTLLQAWRDKTRLMKLISPKYVADGPITKNVVTEETVDLMMFPVPRFHELDGGRYIGTGHTVIIKDPDSEWVNLGTYRCMLLDRNHLTLHMVEGSHGSIICNQKYFARGKVMPVAIAIGVDPALWFSSILRVPYGVSEYDYAGGIEGEPIEVIKGPSTGLPLPAHSEIIIEGECRADFFADEGPFGEWNGYYANLGLTPVPEPIVTVKTLLYRDNPILTCAQPSAPPHDTTLLTSFIFSATIWDGLEKVGIPGIKGVWCQEAGGGSLFIVLSIQQMYAGHAKQAGLIASQLLRVTGRYVVVVDDDIDPSNLTQVTWAISTRTDPERSIEILHGTPSSSMDTMISPEIKRRTRQPPKPLVGSRVVIDACRPFDWKDEFYPVAQVSPGLRLRLLDKWRSVLEEFL